MNKNVGKIDRIGRFVLGAGLLIAGIVMQNGLAVFGVVLLITAAVSFCPLYKIIGTSTCSKEGCETDKPATGESSEEKKD